MIQKMKKLSNLLGKEYVSVDFCVNGDRHYYSVYDHTIGHTLNLRSRKEVLEELDRRIAFMENR